MSEVNAYSAHWFETFLRSVAPEQTAREVDFLVRSLPRDRYTSVLDICCGTGRHALPLAQRGYLVTGLDLDAAALAEARRHASENATFIQGDMRDLSALPGAFGAVLCLWQSFGYFDDATNRDVLRQMRAKLRPQGRLILDLYHDAFFATRLGQRSETRGGQRVRTTQTMDERRLTVRLEYEGAPPDVFEWRLYSPAELRALVESLGLDIVTRCTGFDETQPPSPDQPRMQLVCEAR